MTDGSSTGDAGAAIADRHRVGIVVERRDSDNPWIDATWRVADILPEPPSDDTRRPLDSGPGWRRDYVGSLEVELFKRETEAYKVNLSQEDPVLYVVLRPGEDDDDEEVSPFLATFSPYEAGDYTESGEMIVDAVPAPAVVVAWAAAFVEAFHVDQPFKKRKQKRKEDSATGRNDGARMRPGHG
ncbi:DUF3305 domain-containing protein [Magnetovibrio sp.]|uniref:DUF3305 domain-containing protein n=1 Tax=Magnetovibrio sp. TaxID=2024836 RepID=UPI002F94145E